MYIQFANSGMSSGDYVFLDNILVVPEPATIGLLCLGGLALIRRKK